MNTTQPTPDLDAIALAAAKAVYPFGPATYCWGDDAKNDAARERDWKAIAKRISLTAGFTDAVTEAIAQDRKTRELRAEDGLRHIDEIAHEIISNPGLEKNTVDLVSEMVMWFKTYKQQLAQQSAALVVAKDAMKAAKGFLNYHCPVRSNPEIAQLESALESIAQLAEAPREATRVEPRALTSGEAVEAAEIIDQLVFAAENADQDGYVTDVGFINVDELHAKARDMATKLRAPSRTEREDTAPEVGKGGV